MVLLQSSSLTKQGKKTPNLEALESQGSKHSHILGSMQIYLDLHATRPSVAS